MKIYQSITQLIGKTPLLELPLPQLRENKVRLLAKLESMNPAGSVKDRVANAMIAHAEQTGKLKPVRPLLNRPAETPESAWQRWRQQRDIG